MEKDIDKQLQDILSRNKVRSFPREAFNEIKHLLSQQDTESPVEPIEKETSNTTTYNMPNDIKFQVRNDNSNKEPGSTNAGIDPLRYVYNEKNRSTCNYEWELPTLLDVMNKINEIIVAINRLNKK